MATQFANGKTTTSGLVFMYDTTDKENCYKGEPTTNKAGGVHLGFNGSRWGKTTDYPLKGSLPFQLQGDVYQLINGNNYWGSAGDFSPEYNKTYTLSYWYYLSSDSNLSSWHNSFFGEPQGGGSIYTTVSSKSNDTFSVTGTNTWRYGSVNITTSTPVNSYTYFRGTYTSGGTDNLPSGLVYIANFQLEEKSHPTPFTNSTRSGTEGLKDLMVTSQIDISNVSFDANAQMTFDGSDDHALTSNNVTVNGSQTLTAIAIISGGPQSPAGIISNHDYANNSNFGLNHINGNRIGISIGYTDNTREYDSKYTTYTATVGVPFYIAMTFDQLTNTVKLYVNGILDSTFVLSKTVKFTSRPIVLGRWDYQYNYYYFNGKIPTAQYYNRALTNEEVLQNYNAIKTRFNLA